MLVLLNPIGAVPVFLGVTANQPRDRRNRTALITAVTVGVVIIASVLLGTSVLRAFYIDLPSFQVGGGILVLLMAVNMLQAKQSRLKQTPAEAREAEEQDSVGVVPLGTPLLAGPGTISTAIIFAQESPTTLDYGLLIATTFAVGGCVWLVLRIAEPIGVALGRTGINILTRFMGLVLTAMAVKFITGGLYQLWTELGARG